MAAAKRQNKTQCEAERRAVRCAAKREAKRRAARRDVEKCVHGLLFKIHIKYSKYYAHIYTGVPIGDAALAKLPENGALEDTPPFEERGVNDGHLGGSYFNESAGSR